MHKISHAKPWTADWPTVIYTPVGPVDERVEIMGEVVRSNYSNQYNTHYVTVITEANRQVFFAYRERIEPGANIRICGRVKRHADRATQLSRVKIH
jgi:hypothetical protein